MAIYKTYYTSNISISQFSTGKQIIFQCFLLDCILCEEIQPILFKVNWLMESGAAGVVRIFIIEIIHAIVVLISAEAAIHEIYLFGAPITIGTSALQENLRK